MNSPSRPSQRPQHYLPPCDLLSLFGQIRENICEQQSSKKLLKSKQREQRKERSRKFFHQLQIDDQYQFDSSTNDSLSKKSLKLIKLITKQQQEERRQEQLRNQAEQRCKYSGVDSLVVNDRVGEIERLSQFQQDLSSISYIIDHPTPVDSVWSKLFKTPNQPENKPNQSHQLEDFDSLQHPPIKDTPQYQSPINCSQHRVGQNPQVQTIPLPPPPTYPYKQSSLSFKTVNNYLHNYLHNQPAGIIIHPEYSTIIEDHSQLAVEGKTVRLTVTHKQHKRNKIKVISSHANFLKEVFPDQDQPQGQNVIKQSNNQNAIIPSNNQNTTTTTVNQTSQLS